MKTIVTRYGIVIILSVAGIIGGFLYWRFVGCRTGSCPITSNWQLSIFMGGIIGYLTGDSIKDFKERRLKGRNEGNME